MHLRHWLFLSASMLFFGLSVRSMFHTLDGYDLRARVAESKLRQCDEYVAGTDEPMPGHLQWFPQSGELRIESEDGGKWLGIQLTREGAERLRSRLKIYVDTLDHPDAGGDGKGQWL